MMNFFETKLINATEFNDYLNLSLTPFFLSIDEKKKNQIWTTGKINEHNLGILFLTIPQKGFVKIDSLGSLANELRKYPFIFDEKWDRRTKFIQSMLYP